MSGFDSIYAENLWSGHETRSGPGSSLSSTLPLVAWLVRLVRELGVTTVLDVGCGEGSWMPSLPGYVGVDVVAAAIDFARRTHSTRAYRQLDARCDALPQTDLAFTRDFMQHLTVTEGLQVLANIKKTGARFLVASTYQDGDNSTDPESSWHAYRVNLELSPFGLGTPDEAFCDGYDEAGVLVDRTKMMALWRW